MIPDPQLTNIHLDSYDHELLLKWFPITIKGVVDASPLSSKSLLHTLIFG